MLQLTEIRKSYTTADFTQRALDGVSIAFRKNEFAAILGPSGSGKTTMLNIIGGLDHYDAGDLKIDDISTKKYKDRDWDTYRNNRIGFVFQSYNLIPHQTVLSNVELALTLSGVPKAERQKKAKRALEEVGLGDHIRKRPNQLSGGQMQRVAIARALINDPEILLADEPTGALDTHTSSQVMELLTKIAKDRLVIMVTHNSKLAEKYATRIVHLTDGKVVSDTRPFDPAKEESHAGRAAQKASMSFFTAISLSFSNLMTKKGRTFVTALAGSIGIIGIALILALANGINGYIKTVEEDALSIYPLSIQTSGLDLSGMLGGPGERSPGERPEVEPGYVRERRILARMFSMRSRNDLAALKAHLEDNSAEIDPHVNTIQYLYDVTPQIFLSDTANGAQQVNPDSLLTAPPGMGGGMGMGMGGFGMGVFHEMPGERSMYENQYDVMAGRWPERYDEMVMVLSPGGRVSDVELYAMGLRDRAALREKLVEFMSGTDGTFEPAGDSDLVSYADILSVGFKLVSPTQWYQFDDTFEVWVDRRSDADFMSALVDESENLRIVGIMQPKEGGMATSLSSGLNYTPALVSYLMEQAAQNPLVKEQLENPTVNVLTGKTFAQEQDDQRPAFDFSRIVSVDEAALKDVFQFDPSNLGFDLSAMQGLDGFSLDLDMSALDLTGAMAGFLREEFSLRWLSPNNIAQSFSSYMETYMAEMMQAVGDGIKTQMQNMMQQGGAQLSEQFNLEALSSAFQMNMDESEILELMNSIMNPTESSKERTLKLLGYADPLVPSQINLYPRDFDAKQMTVNFLDAYNEQMEAAGGQALRYTDLVGVMMSSVTKIIDMVTYALVAFVAISLVVSSIMIGVITYISVLERKKEIGILRAIGASKGNIKQVFNAETLIVGFVAGILGVLVSLGASLAGSAIVYAKTDIPNIAQLPFVAAAALVAVSMFLTFIAGLMPASKAAKKDPVEALRSE